MIDQLERSTNIEYVMKINADFAQRVAVHSEEMAWLESPMPGVFRRPLDRVGSEVARATSIVRYAPGSQFSPHVHTGGEEFLVLDGVFQDEHGDFPVGSYMRNPPGSSHTPGSETGCVIFVKLWQFESNDSTQVRMNSNLSQPVPSRERPGVGIIPLHSDSFEEVTIEVWDANSLIELAAPNGLEILVLDGSFTQAEEHFEMHSWLRLPKSSTLTAQTGDVGAKIWLKRHHLDRVYDQIERVNEAATAQNNK